jgi:hypothetical protein
MKYLVCHTKTFYTEVEADSPDGAIAKWEDLDLDYAEARQEPSADVQCVEWHENGEWHSIYY